ncbi:MAG: TonB-dependent receptor [Cyclobacteriaceae bacterium]
MKKLTFLLLLASFCTKAQNFTLNGYVRDSETGENLIGATLIDQNSSKGTISNTFGFYSLTLPTGLLSLKVTYVGYAPQELIVDLTENQQLNVNLIPGSTLEEVVVTADENIEQSPQMSAIDVPVAQIKALPVLMGESDILKTIQLLPGVQSGTEGSSGVYVRGGGADQNLIIFDGVPVYNVSHLFGFFSVFNSDAINRVNVVKGGFPARYGGRLSSVIDISMKEGNNQEFKGEGSIGLISSKLTLEGPVGKDKKTSFILSGRRTYIDLLTRPIIHAASNGENKGGYYFYDFNAKINHKLSEKDRLYLSFYNGRDKGFSKYKSDYRYRLEDGTETTAYNIGDAGIGWGNNIAALRWNHVFTPKLFANVTSTFSKYEFKVFGGSESIYPEDDKTIHNKEYVEYVSGIRDWSAKIDFDYLPSPRHSVKTGLALTYHKFNPGILGYDTNVEGENDTIIGATQTRSLELASYIEDDFSLSNNLRVNAGLHYSGFLVNNKYYNSLQPRFSVRYLLSKNLSLKASYATMTQYVHLLTNGSIGLPTDLWVPATDKIAPQRSWQAAIGVARTFNRYEMSVEGYYKEMNNQITYDEGASYYDQSADWQEKVVVGQGNSYGLEFLLQKKTGRFSGWVGYTLSKTNRQYDDLNFGKWFPYKFDRRHDISIVSVFDVNERFSISGTWVFGTGNAVTIPQSVYRSHDENDPGPQAYDYYYDYPGSNVEYFDSRNNYRMRNYHRLDLGLTWTKEKKWGTRSWSLGAYNVYNRLNPFYMDVQETRTGRKLVQYSLFPVLPYFKYSFKF